MADWKQYKLANSESDGGGIFGVNLEFSFFFSKSEK